MTEVMFKVITLGFQRIIVFNLPPCAPRCNDLCHITLVDHQRGGQCVPVQYLTVFCARGDFAPVCEQRLIGIAQWHRPHITIGIYFAPFAGPAFAYHCLDDTIPFQVIDPFGYKVLCELGLQTRMNSNCLSSKARQKGS